MNTRRGNSLLTGPDITVHIVIQSDKLHQQYLRPSPMWPGDSVNMLEHKDDDDDDEEEEEEEEEEDDDDE